MPSWVYTIVENSTQNAIYVGSTTGRYFCFRRCDHMKPSTTKSRSSPLYEYVKEKGGWEHFNFQIVKTFETIEKQDLLKEEKDTISLLSPQCNLKSPISTKEERDTKKRISHNKWVLNNPEKIVEYVKRRSTTDKYKAYEQKRCDTKIECECGGRYTAQNKTNHFSREIHKHYEANKKPSQN